MGQPLAMLHDALGPWLDRARSELSDQTLVFDLEVRAGRSHSATLSAIRGDDFNVRAPGRPAAGWVMVLEDVTHLKRAEEWRTEAVQAATHDLRNPLNLMNGALNILRDSLRDETPEQRECLAMIRSGLDRMGNLIDQVLNLDQVEGQTDLSLVGIELRRVVELASDDFRLEAEAKGVALTFEGAPAEGRVLGDESWLHRAVTNLVSNALKYTPRGGRVRVRYREADGQAICEVMDTGPGVPSALQPRLFERFYRAPGETTRRTPGTGLGLAIVKAIIERHNGRAWVSSDQGAGSTFGFSVPLARN
jgi:signal transduction histidine kinase